MVALNVVKLGLVLATALLSRQLRARRLSAPIDGGAVASAAAPPSSACDSSSGRPLLPGANPEAPISLREDFPLLRFEGERSISPDQRFERAPLKVQAHALWKRSVRLSFHNRPI